MRIRTRRPIAAIFMLISAMCLPAVATATTCFDPIPDPFKAGWSQEGIGSVQVGTPLGITDPNPAAGAGLSFFCADSTLFTGDIVLTPRVTMAAFGNAPAADGNTGIHVTINDGVKMVRAFVLSSGGSYRVALGVAAGGYSNGFTLIGATLDFTLRRNVDGSGTLSVANPMIGAPPLEETIWFVDLADSVRQNVKTLEFGAAADVQSASSAAWDTLGLPLNKDFPVGLNITDMRIVDVNNDHIRIRSAFTLSPSSDGINPVTDQVNLTISNAAGQFYTATLLPGDFELRGNDRPGRWALTDIARQITGIERFDILLDKKEIFFVDRGTTLPLGSFANVSMMLEIGNDSGTGSVILVEKPVGSGRWRVP